MKAWITSGRKAAFTAALLFAFAPTSYAAGLPAQVGSLVITEVMYDTPGADTGREWLEVTNTGSTPADLTGYKFFESGVNHGLTAVQGGAVLAAGESAVIASNPQKFLADYPGYTGTLFKSSFSLTNTGESLELRDKTLAVVAAVSYASAQGAAGDDNSLHLSGASLVPGAPNPGSNAPTKPIVKVAPAKPVKAVKASAIKTTVKKPSTSSYSSGSNTAYSDTSGAAVGMAPLLHTIPSFYFYVLGLVALIALGVGAVLYARPEPQRAADETRGGSEEFELE